MFWGDCDITTVQPLNKNTGSDSFTFEHSREIQVVKCEVNIEFLDDDHHHEKDDDDDGPGVSERGIPRALQRGSSLGRGVRTPVVWRRLRLAGGWNHLQYRL